MLVKEYIYNYQPDKVVFIVPTNSLADELLDDFQTIFTSYGYVVFDSIKNLEIILEKSIFIGTQEKYYNIKNIYEDKIDLFIIDEAYKLTDPINGSREVILNRSFIDTLEKTDKLILLMPLVNTIKGLEYYEFKILQSDYAPVAKNFVCLKNLNEVIKFNIIENKTINLIYFDSPKELERIYLKDYININNPIDLNTSWINRVEDDFHPNWIPIQALKSGIGIHYGPMPKFIQKKVIELFKTNAINNVLATSSIIEGVNTPTKNIYIYSSNKILGGKNLVKFKNLIGRAGRLGKHKVGNIYYFEKHQPQFEEANVSYKEININFSLNNEDEIIEINRNTQIVQDFDERMINSYEEKIEKHFANFNFSVVPSKEIIELLNKHGFTTKKFKVILEYVESKSNLSFLGIVGKLIGTVEINKINIILNPKISTFKQIVDEINHLDSKVHVSKNVSYVIDMIYSFIPFKIIPIIDFLIDINELYRLNTQRDFVNKKVIREGIQKKRQFYSKFLGVTNPTQESLAIMNKLFEYGIPYQRVKPYINVLEESLPDKFSIHDIKKMIFEDSNMADLRVYFE